MWLKRLICHWHTRIYCFYGILDILKPRKYIEFPIISFILYSKEDLPLWLSWVSHVVLQILHWGLSSYVAFKLDERKEAPFFLFPSGKSSFATKVFRANVGSLFPSSSSTINEIHQYKKLSDVCSTQTFCLICNCVGQETNKTICLTWG